MFSRQQRALFLVLLMEVMFPKMTFRMIPFFYVLHLVKFIFMEITEMTS